MENRLIEFPQITDNRGNLTFIQYPNQVPFEIQRVFWTFNLVTNTKRGGHAYMSQDEVIIAMSGSFEVILTNRDNSIMKVFLNSPKRGLYIPARQWRHVENFSNNAVSLHLSSSQYDSRDYIRDFDLYIQS
ncbi:MAG: FdtA/QdtA family cupin domain-containing protein [Bacteroidetes bacterium]|nr:FdtA/QdtA family cupin domain-containing protein [Bacteroidota bacterium]